MGIHRSHLRRRVREDHAATRIVNRVYKDSERTRRDARMVAMVKAGKFPYAPMVMSWLSRKLDKPSSKITEADLKTVLN